AAADWCVPRAGTPDGTGSKARPLDLKTALKGPSRIQPSDTIWLRDGIYPGTFVCSLRGQPGRPITVRQYPGERATIDGAVLQTSGGWVNYWGFELMKSSPNRVSVQATAEPSDLPYQDGFNIRAPSVKCINLVVHDVVGN